MSELSKLRKLFTKLEKRYENAGPVEQKRIMKKTIRVEQKIRYLTRRPHEKGM